MTPTYTGGQSEGHVQPASEATVADRVEMSVNDKETELQAVIFY